VTVHRIVCTFFLALLPSVHAAFAQQPQPAVPPTSRDIHLDVAIDSKSGLPPARLTQQDFTVLDNKAPRPITSFKIMTSAEDPVSVIVIVDAVNIPYPVLAWSRQGVEKFLKANEGQVPYPTAVAVLTDQGIQIEDKLSTDGNALSDSLERHTIGLREITRDSQWGALDRMQICLKAFDQLVAFAPSLPGRKIVLWISPGWPLISGAQIEISARQEQEIFNQVVDYSTRLRQTDLTLYDINPIGASESLQEASEYQSYLKGVSKPYQAQFGDLSLQVLAIQSGGLAIEGNSDVAGTIQKILADAQSWYRIAFDPVPADKPNDYHHIEIKVDRPGFTARTRDGYYSNSLAANPAH